MKKLLVVLLVFISFTSVGQRYIDVVEFIPLNLIKNSVSFRWKHIEDKKAILVTVGIPMNNTPIKNWFEAPESKLHTYNLSGEYRCYFKEKMYYGVKIGWETMHGTSELQYGKADGYLHKSYMNLGMGYQMMIGKRIMIDIIPAALQLSLTNGRIETHSNDVYSTNEMFKYVTNMSEKLPNSANIEITRNGNTINGFTNVFFHPRIVSEISIGFKF